MEMVSARKYTAMNEPRRIMVTGAAGFVGVPLTAELVRLGYHVVAVDSDYFGTLSVLTNFEAVSIRRMDFRELSVEDLRDVHSVIHLAAIPNDPSGALFPEETCLDVNGRCVGTLAERALAAGCEQFVFMSTCSVYGSRGNGDDWCDEESSVDPMTTYAKAKVLGENALRKVAYRGLRTIILRSATLYGASPARTRFDLPVNRFCLHAHWHGRVYAVAREIWRPLITVVDAARALAYSVKASIGRCDCITMNLGATSFNWRLGEVADLIGKIFHVPVTKVPLGRDIRSYRVRCDRLQRLLPEAVPDTEIEEGVLAFRYILRMGSFGKGADYQPRWNAQNGYQALLATGELDSHARRPERPFGVPVLGDLTRYGLGEEP